MNKAFFNFFKSRFFTQFPKIILMSMSYYSFSLLTHNFNKQKISCIFNMSKQQKIKLITKDIVTIKQNNEVIGYCYCIAPQIFVTVCSRIYQNEGNVINPSYQFQNNNFHYTHIELIGKFDNISFLKIRNNHIKPSLNLPIQSQIFSECQILNKKQYFTLSNSYLVQKQNKYGILSSDASLGSLVLSNGDPLGLVSSIGRDNLTGFAKMVFINDLKSILKRIESGNLNPYLGISVKNKQHQQGLFVIRISSDSPLYNNLRLGDTIIKINGQKVIKPQDIQRFINISNFHVQFTVQNNGYERNFEIKL